VPSRPAAMDKSGLLDASADVSSAPPVAAAAVAVPSPAPMPQQQYQQPPPQYQQPPPQQYQQPPQQASAPPAGTVAQLMPSAPPLESLRDTYSAAGGQQYEDHGQPPSSAGTQLGAADGSVASYNFFQPAELQVLQAQAVPVDNFQLNTGGGAPVAQAVPVAQAMPVAQATPVLTTNVGVPIFDPATVRSSAATEQDSNDGVKSSDACLTSVDEVFKFLNTYNTRPRIAARVHGYHRERRTRTVTREDSEGNKRTEREEYWVTVTDFEYSLDLTEFIFPYGFIQSMDDKGQDVAALISAYLSDDNMLKTLEMKKEISFDFNALSSMIYGCGCSTKPRA
jgi:hypothetical protein